MKRCITITDRMTFRHHRENGLTEAIAEAQDPQVKLTLARSPRFDEEAHRAAIRRMLSTSDRPTAIVGLFDELALMVMREAQDMGLSIPRDLSVTGFDDVPAAAFATPGLTTFDQATRESGREIAQMLNTVIDGEGPVTRLKMPRLIERGSHGPAPKRTQPRIRHT